MVVRTVEARTDERRVAAYARVSTLREEQEESYATQVGYYTSLIRGTPGWQFVRVYSDQGFSGTSAERRPGLQQLIRDAAAGLFDLLLVKSMSRLARNAMEANTLIHRLRDMRVEVRFDRENISTADASSDMLLSVLASIAEEEIRAASERVKWSYRRLMDMGIRHMGSNRILGYDERDGVLVPNGDAWIVREAFRLYAEGLTPRQVAMRLEEMGARRLRGGVRWTGPQVLSMLANVTYSGDRLLQKKPPLNCLTHRPDPTEEYDSVYVSDDHEALIDRELFDRVQAMIGEVKKRREDGVYLQTRTGLFYGILRCECGNPFTRVTERKGEGRIAKWKCRERLKGRKGSGCRGYIWEEDELKVRIAGKLGCTVEDLEEKLRAVDRIVADGEGGLTVIMK